MAESRHWRRASLSSRETVRARERNRLSARSCTSTLPTRSTSFPRSRSLALVFTGLQVRQANRARRDQAAVTVIQTALSENSARILELFGEIPEDTSASLIDNLDAQTQRAILEFGLRLEVMGYMAFRRLVDLETVNELAGGAVLGFWSRVKRELGSVAPPSLTFRPTRSTLIRENNYDARSLEAVSKMHL